MANKTATLKNQAGDNIYPNIVGDNRNAAIKDSTTIKHTLAENKISLDLDETVKGKIDAALQKPTGLTKTKLVGVGASGQENIEIGDNLTLANGKLAAAGGKSVPPTLNLYDFETGEIRTSITEEEYNNLKNGLYNQVIYAAESPYETYLQSKLFSTYNDINKSLSCVFSSIKVTATSETDISSTNIIYQLDIGQKDTSGNYPITIHKIAEIPFGSNSGSSASSDSMHVIIKEETNGKITLTEAEFDNLTKDNYELAITKGGDLFIYDEKSVIKDSSTGNVDSIGFICNTVRGTGQLILMNTSSVEFTRDNLVSDIVKITSLMTESKLFNKKVMTYDSYSPENILPCTTADNGKVLSVVNGEAQWANAGGASVQSIDAYGEGGATTIEKGKISTDLTDVNLKVPFVLNIYEDSTLSGTPTRIVMTNKVGEIYLGNLDFINHYLVQMTKGTDGKYSYSSNIIPNPTENTLFNKPILVPEDLVDPAPILPCTTADNGKVLSVVNGEAQWTSASGGVTVTFED